MCCQQPLPGPVLSPGLAAPRHMGPNAIAALLGRQLPLPVFNAGAGG